LVRRVDLKRLAEISDGLFFVALLPVGDAPVVVGIGIIRVERDGLGEVGDGAVNPTLPPVGDAPVVVGEGIIRVERDGFGVVVDGEVRIVRRLKREVGALGGILCRQWSNLYSFSAPAKQLDLGATTAPPRLPPKPRVHYIDGSPDQEVFNRNELASSEAFSPLAIQMRRAQAGLR